MILLVHRKKPSKQVG